MSKFRYIGEYPEGKAELVVYGCVFSPGAEIVVPSQFVGKASGNRFFEAVEDAPSAAPEAAEPRNRLLDAAEAFSKEDLIARATELGVKIDKRWSAEKIAAAIGAKE